MVSFLLLPLHCWGALTGFCGLLEDFEVVGVDDVGDVVYIGKGDVLVTFWLLFSLIRDDLERSHM